MEQGESLVVLIIRSLVILCRPIIFQKNTSQSKVTLISVQKFRCVVSKTVFRKSATLMRLDRQYFRLIHSSLSFRSKKWGVRSPTVAQHAENARSEKTTIRMKLSASEKKQSKPSSVPLWRLISPLEGQRKESLMVPLSS